MMEILQYIVDETNRYALQCMGETEYNRWNEVTPSELEAFCGFMILMGLVRLPAISDYWRKDMEYHYKAIASQMTRDRTP